VVSHVVDVRDEASVVAMFQRSDGEWGDRLDVVANIAGIGSTDPAPTTTVEVWDNVFASTRVVSSWAASTAFRA
jgi:NAD(P)-dependent dehydrogenase (short-subunit alcohol dehydrogenase family)